MCGISGLWNLNREPVDREELIRFTRSLAHRGPDAEGIRICDRGSLGLGHRRLSILDLSPAGAQPMVYGGGRYWIVFNGEVYNFVELRRELEQLGHQFSTDTDTEVVLASYIQWGQDCQLRFNGMWAFAIWDETERELFLSRDRFGVKPLYFLAQPDRFAFASEMKAFLQLDRFSPTPNEQAMLRVLHDPFCLEATDECLLEGLQRLRAGHCIRLRNGDLLISRWWNTLDHLPTPPRGLREQAQHFRELFLDACRLRQRSDVPVATCVSGGLDSSAVLCSLAQLSRSSGSDTEERRAKDWQRAYVLSFPDNPLDERRYAEIAIRHAGATPRICPMPQDAVVDHCDDIIFNFEDLYNILPAPLWAIYRELRRDGSVVSLDGHGADEQLGGYKRHTDAALAATGGFLQSPRRTAELAGVLSGLFVPNGPGVRPSRADVILNSDARLRYWSRRVRGWGDRLQGVTREQRSAALARHASPVSTGLAPLLEAVDAQLDPAEEREIDALGPLNAYLYRDFHRTMLPTILRNFDRCSMAHGVEVRMPFMDWRLVTYVFSLPDEAKIGGGFTKRVLRDSMRGILPESIRTRKDKIGFSSPLPEWFSGSLKTWLLDQVHDADFLQSPLWNGSAVREYVERASGEQGWDWASAERVWQIVHAYRWTRVFARGFNRINCDRAEVEALIAN